MMGSLQALTSHQKRLVGGRLVVKEIEIFQSAVSWIWYLGDGHKGAAPIGLVSSGGYLIFGRRTSRMPPLD